MCISFLGVTLDGVTLDQTPLPSSCSARQVITAYIRHPHAIVRPRERSSLRSAVQKSHPLIYTAAFLTALAGHASGFSQCSRSRHWLIPSPVRACMGSSAVESTADPQPHLDRYRIFLVTLGVYASGGAASPWFIWFGHRRVDGVRGRQKASYLVSLARGCVRRRADGDGTSRVLDSTMLLVTRMLFLFGASFFFLAGIANLQAETPGHRELENEQARELTELTRLTRNCRSAGTIWKTPSRRIQEADRLKSQFLANMTTSLRTADELEFIGFSEILIGPPRDSIDPKPSLPPHISPPAAPSSASSTTSSISRRSRPADEIYAERFESSVIESVCTVMRGMGKTKIRRSSSKLIRISADRETSQVQAILYNLLSNAMKFSPPESPISISAMHSARTRRRHDHHLRARSGIGIDPRSDVIFEEFRQIDGTAPRVRRHRTGLRW